VHPAATGTSLLRIGCLGPLPPKSRLKQMADEVVCHPPVGMAKRREPEADDGLQFPIRSFCGRITQDSSVIWICEEKL
jgi:hypothetical protein